MKRAILFFAVMLMTGAMFAQADPAPAPAPGEPQRLFGQGPGPGGGMRERGMRERGMRERDGMRGGMRGMPGGKWWKDSHLAQAIGLTDQQAQQIEKIFQDHRLQLIDLHAGLDKQEALMEPMMEADQPNESQVNAQIDKIAQARAALEKSNAQMLLGIRRVLSTEQWKKLQQYRPEPPMGGIRGGVPGEGPGGPWPRRGMRPPRDGVPSPQPAPAPPAANPSSPPGE